MTEPPVGDTGKLSLIKETRGHLNKGSEYPGKYSQIAYVGTKLVSVSFALIIILRFFCQITINYVPKRVNCFAEYVVLFLVALGNWELVQIQCLSHFADSFCLIWTTVYRMEMNSWLNKRTLIRQNPTPSKQQLRCPVGAVMLYFISSAFWVRPVITQECSLAGY